MPARRTLRLATNGAHGVARLARKVLNGIILCHVNCRLTPCPVLIQNKPYAAFIEMKNHVRLPARQNYF
jgi:hypothetical protein